MRCLIGEYIKFELDLVDLADGVKKGLYFHHYLKIIMPLNASEGSN